MFGKYAVSVSFYLINVSSQLIFITQSIFVIQLISRNGKYKEDGMRYVYATSKLKRYSFPTHTNELVIDRSESAASEVFIVLLEPGQAPPVHEHPDAEQLFYIIEGEGSLVIGKRKKRYSVKPGDVVRIPPSTPHSVVSRPDKPLKYLAIDCFVNGKPAEEPTWDEHVKALCKRQGWDYNKVVVASCSEKKRGC
jgi:mannose-6-phosphate isomerase-like protein (cupin superfamily)